MSDDGLIGVAGEALVDLVASDTTAFRAHLGGGPFNAARTIGRLAQPVAFLGGLLHAVNACARPRRLDRRLRELYAFGSLKPAAHQDARWQAPTSEVADARSGARVS